MVPADWSNTPEVILSRIFGFCDLFTRLKVPDVCRSWHSACHRGESWSAFVYSEYDLVTEVLFSEYKEGLAEQLEAINKRIIDVIRLFGKGFRSVTLELTDSASYDVLEQLSITCRQLRHLTVLRSCKHGILNQASPKGKWLKTVLLENTKLRHVCIENIDFVAQTKNEAIPLGTKHTGLKNLRIINSFFNNSLSSLMYLVNLKELWLCPQLLNYFMIKQLSSLSLRTLYIVGTRRCPHLYTESISDNQWREIRQVAPKLKVHCRLSGTRQWSEEALLLNVALPVVSLVYAKYAWLDYTKLVPLILNYNNTLHEYVDCNVYDLPDPDISVEYHGRVDAHVLKISKECLSLHTLCLKTVISSSMLLLMVKINKSLKNLYIREDTIKYCWDLPVDELALEQEDIEFAKQHWCQRKFCEGISSVLGYSWEPLSKDSYADLVRSKYCGFY